MTHTPLKSSMISSAGWEDGILEVTFRNTQKTWSYGATKEIYEGLITAESPGSYFMKNIKGKLTVFQGTLKDIPAPMSDIKPGSAAKDIHQDGAYGIGAATQQRPPSEPSEWDDLIL